MKNVYVIGSFSTPIKKWTEKSIKDLTRDAYLGVLKDALIDSNDLEFLWFSNCGWGHSMSPMGDDPGVEGQMNVRGQAAFTPLVSEGLFPRRVPCVNVEGACSSGSLAFNGAWKDILSGQCEVSLALGVEKTYYPNNLNVVVEMFKGGLDVGEIPRLIKNYETIAKQCGKEWDLSAAHTLFMDIYATLAAWHMKRWGTTIEQLAVVASKNHWHGMLNPLAQYQFEVPVEKVLSDYSVSWPLTRSMCAPLGDGAAAAILCSEDYLNKQPIEVKQRAVKVLSSVVAGGYEKDIDSPGVSQWAATRAYQNAGIGPNDIDLAEVHDATAFAEILQTEMLGFCAIGEGGRYAESGATRLGGEKPINTSGGLESKGHPIGATGLSQINEVVIQLRGEAGKRQVNNASTGLIENGGGIVSFEEYCCVVTILSRA